MQVFVAMSGGVDSAVAALLLKRAGHRVVGIHLRTGVKAEAGAPGRPRCCGADEADDARRVCGLLGLPFYVQDTERDFRRLIRDFAAAYARGETPNPCVACNSDIKFGALLERARALGADAVATGHYARRVRRENGRWAVARARDTAKDQSYVLYGLGQEELAHARFPLGELEKGEVRRLAREAGLPVAEKPESQEICFVPTGDYRDVVRELSPEAFEPGEIVDPAGRVLGRHEGVGDYTVGQRRRLRLSAPEPLYVLRLERGERRVVVGPRSALGNEDVVVDEVRWTAIDAPRSPIRVEAMLRYRAQRHRATLTARVDGTARLQFEKPAWPVTPGQAAVFYDPEGDCVLGGGRIRPCS